MKNILCQTRPTEWLIEAVQLVPRFERYVCVYAALNGHIEVIQWDHENDWDLDDRLEDYSYCHYEQQFEICSSAARGGQLEFLKWARANGYPWGNSV